MYICDKCGNLVEKLDTYTESRPYGDSYCYEEMENNECGCGGEYTEAEICEVCGNYENKLEMELIEKDKYICNKCIDNVREKLQNLLYDKFDDTEREIIKDIIWYEDLL